MAGESLFQNQRAPWLTLDPTAAGSVTTPPDAGDYRLFVDPTTFVLSYKDASGNDHELAGANRFDGTTAPTANEDSADGYTPGSIWVDTTNDVAYVCVDASAAAAVWTEITQSGGGGGGVTTGTSFPGTPTTGDQYRRSDLDYETFYYDGTRWLSDQVRTISWHEYDASNGAFQILALPDNYDVYLTRWHVALYSNDSNTAWGFNLYVQDFDTGNTQIGDQTITMTAANQWRHATETLGDYVDTTGTETTGQDTSLQLTVDEDVGGSVEAMQGWIELRRVAT